MEMIRFRAIAICICGILRSSIQFFKNILTAWNTIAIGRRYEHLHSIKNILPFKVLAAWNTDAIGRYEGALRSAGLDAGTDYVVHAGKAMHRGRFVHQSVHRGRAQRVTLVNCSVDNPYNASGMVVTEDQCRNALQ